MRKLVLAAALALGAAATAQAAIVELNNAPAVAGHASHLRPVMFSDVVAVASPVAAGTATRMSELPEPEVFAMMLLGLCLIGYRVSRDSSDKFE